MLNSKQKNELVHVRKQLTSLDVLDEVLNRLDPTSEEANVVGDENEVKDGALWMCKPQRPEVPNFLINDSYHRVNEGEEVREITVGVALRSWLHSFVEAMRHVVSSMVHAKGTLQKYDVLKLEKIFGQFYFKMGRSVGDGSPLFNTRQVSGQYSSIGRSPYIRAVMCWKALERLTRLWGPMQITSYEISIQYWTR